MDTHTHYCDLTGEPPFVREMIDRHHEAAVACGVKIVNCCGYDCVPVDLAVMMGLEEIQMQPVQPQKPQKPQASPLSSLSSLSSVFFARAIKSTNPKGWAKRMSEYLKISTSARYVKREEKKRRHTLLLLPWTCVCVCVFCMY